MKKTYTYNMSKVQIENGVVVFSNTESVKIGQTNVEKMLKACGWKLEKAPKTVYAKGLDGKAFYN